MAEVLLVAVLTVRRDRLDDFRAYEGKAAAIMARHGGVIERALVLENRIAQPDDADSLRELHIVRFVDEAALAAYRADAELFALRGEREACIASTEVWSASEGPRYGAITSSEWPAR